MSDFSEFLAWEQISRDSIDLKMTYIDIADGDHAAGILLSQIVYWYVIPGADGKTKLRVKRDGKFWIAKGRDDWYDEVRLSARQFDRASDILVDIGVLEKRTMKFGGAPRMHVRLVPERFLEIWDGVISNAKESVDNLTWIEEDLSDPTLPTGEVQIQRPLEGDSTELAIVFQDDEEPSSTQVEVNTTDLGTPKDRQVEPRSDRDEEKMCPECGARPAIEDYEFANGRCVWCMLVDSWEAWVKVRTPRRSGTAVSRKLAKKAETRWRDDGFRNNWHMSLMKASKMKHLTSSSWFTMDFFIRNDENWRKIFDPETGDGLYDGFERQKYPSNYARLKEWLGRGAAGIDSSKPASVGWAPIGGGQ